MFQYQLTNHACTVGYNKQTRGQVGQTTRTRGGASEGLCMAAATQTWQRHWCETAVEAASTKHHDSSSAKAAVEAASNKGSSRSSSGEGNMATMAVAMAAVAMLATMRGQKRVRRNSRITHQQQAYRSRSGILLWQAPSLYLFKFCFVIYILYSMYL